MTSSSAQQTGSRCLRWWAWCVLPTRSSGEAAPSSDVLDKRSAIQDLSQMARCQHKETLDQVQGVGVFYSDVAPQALFFDVPDKQSAIRDLFDLAPSHFKKIPDNCFAISGTSEFLGAQFLGLRNF